MEVIKDDEASRRNWWILWNRIRKQNALELAASDWMDAAFLPELQPPPGDLWGQSSQDEKLLGDGVLSLLMRRARTRRANTTSFTSGRMM